MQIAKFISVVALCFGGCIYGMLGPAGFDVLPIKVPATALSYLDGMKRSLNVMYKSMAAEPSPEPCAPKDRAHQLRTLCGSATGSRSTVHSMIVNTEKKMALCTISKSASTATVHHFRALNQRYYQLPELKVQTYSRLTTWRFKGFRRITRLPRNVIQTVMANFTKIILVRHPLQRLISAYYQLRPRYGWPTVADFFRHIYNESGFDARSCWETYTKSCLLGDVEYDYVFKSESSDRDFDTLGQLLGQRVLEGGLNERHIKKTNPIEPGVTVRHPFKYDLQLRNLASENPDLFSLILEKADREMKLFGYSWQQNRSRCHYNEAGCC